MATIKDSSEEWYLRDGTMKLWLVLAVSFLIYFARSSGTDANAMPVRTGPQGEAEWMANGGAGAGREVQVAAKNSGATWTECNDEVLSGKRQDVKRLPQERTYHSN